MKQGNVQEPDEVSQAEKTDTMMQIRQEGLRPFGNAYQQDNALQRYIIGKTVPHHELQLELEAYAAQHHVPIISRDSLDMIMTLLRIHRPKHILEFGTAIGYSAIMMASAARDVQVTTFERDEARYEQAMDNIRRADLTDRIHAHLCDAQQAAALIAQSQYDFVFIDAAKAQYQRFFDMVYDYVVPGGVIVSDNIFYREMVCLESERDVPKRDRTIYKRMRAYLDFLKNHPERFFTSLVPIGDGLAITYKREKE